MKDQKKRTWGRFSDQSDGNIDNNTHYSIQQGWMAIFLPFVPLAAIAVVLSQVTDVDLLSRYETTLSAYRQASNDLQDVMETTGRDSLPEALAHMEKAGEFKSRLEQRSLESMVSDVKATLDWFPNEVSPADLPHGDRLSLIIDYAISTVAKDIDIDPGDLEKKTIDAIENKVAPAKLDDLELDIYEVALNHTPSGPVLTACDIANTSNLSGIDQWGNLKPKIVKRVTKEVHPMMMDPPYGGEAVERFEKRIEAVYGDELSRLHNEDYKLAGRIKKHPLQQRIELAVAIDTEKAGNVVRKELEQEFEVLASTPSCLGVESEKMVNSVVDKRVIQELELWDLNLAATIGNTQLDRLGAMRLDQRDSREFSKQTIVFLLEDVGLNELKGWRSELPKAAWRLDERVEQHVKAQKQIVTRDLNEQIAALNLNWMDNPNRNDLVVQLANYGEILEFEENLKNFAGKSNMQNVLKYKDLKSALSDKFAKLIREEATSFKDRIKSEIKGVKRANLVSRIKPEDHQHRKQKISDLSNEILRYVEKKRFDSARISDPRLLNGASLLAQTRATEIFDESLIASTDDLAEYARSTLTNRIERLSVGRFRHSSKQKMMQNLIRGLFPVSNNADESIRGTTYESIQNTKTISSIEKFARKSINDKVVVLQDTAKKDLAEIDQLEALEQVTLPILNDAELTRQWRASAVKEIHGRLGDLAAIEGVENSIQATLDRLLRAQRELLLQQGFSPVLITMSLEPEEYASPCKLRENWIATEIETYAESLIERTKNALKITGEFEFTGEIQNVAIDHAKTLLEERRDKFASTQLLSAENLAPNGIEVEVFNTDTLEDLLARDAARIFNSINCYLASVHVEFMGTRTEKAVARIEEVRMLNARFEDGLKGIRDDANSTDIPPELVEIPNDEDIRRHTKKRSSRELASLISKLQEIKEATQDRQRVAQAAATVPIPDSWFMTWRLWNQEQLEDYGRNDNLTDYKNSILVQARLPYNIKNTAANSEAIDQATRRLIKRGLQQLQMNDREDQNQQYAEKKIEELRADFRDDFKTRFDKEGSAGERELIKSRKDIEKDIRRELVNRDVEVNALDLVLEGLTKDVMKLQGESREQRMKMKMALWGRGFVEKHPEKLVELVEKLQQKKLLTDLLALDLDNAEVSSESVVIMLEIVKQIFEKDRAPELLNFLNYDLRTTSRRIMEQITNMLQYGLYSNDKYDGVVQSIAQAQGHKPPIVVPPIVVPPVANSAAAVPPVVVSPVVTAKPQKSKIKKPPPNPEPPKARPIDVVIAIYQPDKSSSKTIVNVARYDRLKLPLDSTGVTPYLALRTHSFKLTGSNTPDNFRKWGESLDEWLSGYPSADDGLAGVVSKTLGGVKTYARDLQIRVHVMISNDGLMGFSKVVINKVVPGLEQRFLRANALKSMEATTWSDWDEKRISFKAMEGGEELVPEVWPSEI